ncbi:pggt1b [Trichonephila clavipes]|nr:pggt1b [Trichonephila clavipes]
MLKSCLAQFSQNWLLRHKTIHSLTHPAKEPFPIPTLEYATVPLYQPPFATYSKSTVAPVVFQRVFAYHRSQYSRYSAIYTDGSKRADYVGCGVVIEDIMHGYRLDTSCSIFTAEAVAIYPCTSINRLPYAP